LSAFGGSFIYKPCIDHYINVSNKERFISYEKWENLGFHNWNLAIKGVAWEIQ